VGCPQKTLNKTEDYRVYPLKGGSTVKPANKSHAYDIDVKQAIHRDLSTQDDSVGFILNLKMNDHHIYRVGFTGDTKYSKEILEEYVDCDVLLFNISSLPYREMRYFTCLNELAAGDVYQE
jgi:ribonuclease BN (tRNA processing enzyme)